MDIRNDIVIENVMPQIDCGSYPAKRKVGDTVMVTADIFTHGTSLLSADLLYRKVSDSEWSRAPMNKGENDSWSGCFAADTNTTYQYTVEAWVDVYSTWLSDLKKWHASGEDVSADLRSGIAMLKGMAQGTGVERARIAELAEIISRSDTDTAVRTASNEETLKLATSHQPREKARYRRQLEIVVDRKIAGFSSWYELFPRSQSAVRGRHGTFDDCISRLDDIATMGFDVLYLTPIHPIGITNRRGKNGSTTALKSDPGSPWAIGNSEGGHKSINPELGTMADFKRLLAAARGKGLEVAMDIAFQCSPDHPYVREHPQWFYRREDGSIRYAENPPKKYFDIYPLNFESSDWKGLWEELRSIFLYWIDAGVRIFRVDNPHTKPFAFWEWVITSIRKEHPDVIFLSEAFTRPKVMYELSRIGFTQSYTYFTWKNFNWELEEYFTEISRPGTADYFRPNLFTNTPDILPYVLQNGGRPAFMMRALLASTLSPIWGMYSGFELCENEALPGREEYMNSEKYELRHRDWNRSGNIRQLITTLNEIRRKYSAFQGLGNTEFLPAGNPNIVAYVRKSSAGDSAALVVVNINPFEPQDTMLRVPASLFGTEGDSDYSVRDLLTGEIFRWHGEYNYVRLDPGERPGHILVPVG